MSSPIAQISADARILLGEFSKLKKGDIATYEQIAQWIGRDIRANRNVMHTVRKRLQKDYGIWLVAVPKVGYMVANDSLVVNGVCESYRRRMHNAARKAVAALSTVQPETLQEEDKKKFWAELSLHGTLQAVTTKKGFDRIAKVATNGASHQLAIAQTLEALKPS